VISPFDELGAYSLPSCLFKQPERTGAGDVDMNDEGARGFTSPRFYDTKSSFRNMKSAGALHQMAFSLVGFSFRIAKSST